MLILGIQFSGQAQYVTIPDSNFGTWLNANGYFTCMNGSNSTGWYLDTTCSTVTSATSMYCQGVGIRDLTGIQYFKSLNVLDCSGQSLTILPPLPITVDTLICNDNNLTSLPTLPNSLTYIICSNNNLTSLPSLPVGLRYLYCNYNKLTSLPNLPNSLIFLACIFNQLTSLPTLNTSLVILACFGNPINCLPILPNSLQGILFDTSRVHCLSRNVLSMLVDTGPVQTITTYLICTGGNVNACAVACTDTAVTISDSICSNGAYTIGTHTHTTAGIYIDTISRLQGCDSVITLLLSIQTIGCVLSPNNYAIIPDSNFGKWLHTNGYSPCMTGNSTTGWYLDTTCNAVLSALSIDCSNQHIRDLTGIIYFRGLLDLNCGHNDLTSLPSLLNTLTAMSCNNNQLTSLPLLPDSLISLDCSGNLLSSLPTLPALFDNLFCDSNQLTTLPNFPASFRALICRSNPLVSLPILPSQMIVLYCEYNQLTSLPKLPDSLTTLSCGKNQITNLPFLPATLIRLYCNDNPLHCLPLLPKTLETIYFDSSQVHCLSRNVQFMFVNTGGNQSTLTYPICAAGNTNGCAVACTDTAVTISDSICSNGTYTIGTHTHATAGLYTDTISSSLGCDSIITLHLSIKTVGCTVAQDSVWPGDANNDKVVDNNDLLPIGLAYSVSGQGRTGASIVWKGQPSAPWVDTLPSGENDKYIDCNGDGIIDANDTLAIIQNWSLTHNKRAGSDPWRAGAPLLKVQFDKASVNSGDTLTASIVLGDVGQPLTSIYGLSFTLHYDVQAIDMTKSHFNIAQSWFGTSSNSIHLYKNNPAAGTIQCAITGINHLGRSGYGMIASFMERITTSKLSGSTYSNKCYISDVHAADTKGSPLSLNTVSDSTGVVYKPTGITEITNLKLYVAPNPASQQVTIATSSEMTDIHIYDVLGQAVLHTTPSRSQRETLDVSSLTAGVYMVQVSSSSGRGNARLVIK
jgi:hypothetical protein